MPPLGDSFAAPPTTAPKLRSGRGVLRDLLPGTVYQVLHIWKPDGAFLTLVHKLRSAHDEARHERRDRRLAP